MLSGLPISLFTGEQKTVDQRTKSKTTDLKADFGGPANSARLAFSFASPDEIGTGIERLASLLPAAASPA